MPFPEGPVPPPLKDAGLYGYAIVTLVTAVGGLGSFIALQWRSQRKTDSQNARRIETERDLLREALNNAAAAIEANTKVSEKRNEVIEELSKSIDNWSNSNEVIKERTSAQHASNTEKLRDIKLVIDSLAEANRTTNGIITDLRNVVMLLQAKIDGLSNAQNGLSQKIDALPRGRNRS